MFTLRIHFRGDFCSFFFSSSVPGEKGRGFIFFKNLLHPPRNFFKTFSRTTVLREKLQTCIFVSVQTGVGLGHFTSSLLPRKKREKKPRNSSISTSVCSCPIPAGISPSLGWGNRDLGVDFEISFGVNGGILGVNPSFPAAPVFIFGARLCLREQIRGIWKKKKNLKIRFPSNWKRPRACREWEENSPLFFAIPGVENRILGVDWEREGAERAEFPYLLMVPVTSWKGKKKKWSEILEFSERFPLVPGGPFLPQVLDLSSWRGKFSFLAASPGLAAPKKLQIPLLNP